MVFVLSNAIAFLLSRMMQAAAADGLAPPDGARAARLGAAALLAGAPALPLAAADPPTAGAAAAAAVSLVAVTGTVCES